MTTITIQPANTPSGEYNVNLPLPYPYHVDAATGDVGRQEFWKGEPAAVLGFQNDPDVQIIDLLWADAAKHPEDIVGKYVVTANADGGIYNETRPITSVHVNEEAASEVP